MRGDKRRYNISLDINNRKAFPFMSTYSRTGDIPTKLSSSDSKIKKISLIPKYL